MDHGEDEDKSEKEYKKKSKKKKADRKKEKVSLADQEEDDDEDEIEEKRLGDETNTRWITKSIAEEFGRELVLKATCYEFLIHISFMILFTIGVLGTVSFYSYYLTAGLTQQFSNTEFNTTNDKLIKLPGVVCAADFFKYLENHLVPSIFWESTNDPEYAKDNDSMNILYENRVLGVPRLRQVKVRNDSCVIHEYFRRLFLSCFATYSSDAKDTETFGPGNSTAWWYSDESITKSLSYWGRICTYEGGGYYLDLVRNRNKTTEMIHNLKANMWVRRGTRAVFVDFVVYNKNVNLIASCKIVFEFPPVGGVLTKTEFLSMKLLRFRRTSDWITFGCELAAYVFIIYFIIEAVREMMFFKWKYIRMFWNYVEWTIILCTIVGAIYSLREFFIVLETIKFIRDHPDDYANLEYLTSIYTIKNKIFAVNLFFIFMKVFKYLNFNRTMGQLNSTMRRCVKDILGFSVMFFIVFLAFAELGYLLFGSVVENFSSFTISMFTLLRTVLGDFNYAEIEAADRVLAPLYFLSYIFLVFFVLLNMFLAIINDTYADVKTEIALAPDELQMSEYLRKKLFHLMSKLGCKLPSRKRDKDKISATIRQIRDVLKKCGFSDLEIEMFFARYNINPMAEASVNVSDVDSLVNDLKESLQTDDDKSGKRYATAESFRQQQRKLEEIDKTLAELVSHVKQLLQKLDQMEGVKKVPL